MAAASSTAMQTRCAIKKEHMRQSQAGKRAFKRLSPAMAGVICVFFVHSCHNSSHLHVGF